MAIITVVKFKLSLKVAEPVPNLTVEPFLRKIVFVKKEFIVKINKGLNLLERNQQIPSHPSKQTSASGNPDNDP